MQGTIGMPYGPGYQQPSPPTPGNISSGGKSGGLGDYSNIINGRPMTPEERQQTIQTNTQNYLSRNPYNTNMGGTQDLYNQYANYAGNLNNKFGADRLTSHELVPQTYQNWLSQQTPLPPAQTPLQQTSTTNPVLQGPGDLTGQIGMPAGPGYMQPPGGKSGAFNPFGPMPYDPSMGGNQKLWDEYNRQRQMDSMLMYTKLPGQEFGGGYQNWLKNLQNQQYDPMQDSSLNWQTSDQYKAYLNDPSYKAVNWGTPEGYKPIDYDVDPVQWRKNQEIMKAYEEPLRRQNQINLDTEMRYRDQWIQQQRSNPNAPKTMYDYYGGFQPSSPAGPGYMQPTPLPSPTVKTQPTPLPPGTGYMPGLITKIPGMPTNPVLQGPGDLTGQIGMPAGPGYMQPAPKVVATPPATPLNPLGTIGLPYGPGYTAPTMKPVLKSPAVPVPQTPQQIAQQVGIRANPVQPRTTARPIYRPKAY
jgi:hypothetical protein